MTRDSSSDVHPLRCAQRPPFEEGHQRLRAVDLFAGCGGLTLGVAQAAHKHDAGLDIPLAVDFNVSAIEVFRSNFPRANAMHGRVEDFFDGDLGSEVTPAESNSRGLCGPVDLLIGGPPCQGHSDLNNRTRRDDPKNRLYVRMARAAEIIHPRVVLIENVPAVQHDKQDALGITIRHLEEVGYTVGAAVVPIRNLGVAQTRKRHIVLAAKDPNIQPQLVLDTLREFECAGIFDLRWAIGDLASITEGKPYDRPPKASNTNLRRMKWLLDNDEYDLPNYLRPSCHQDDHSYKSMYGRLRWTAPAQTLTSGYSSIGQGRYMHPNLPRALTGHEAARIQGFPDYYLFDSVVLRAELADIIGNAVPPALGCAVTDAVIPNLGISEELVITERELVQTSTSR
jgi:DNA (cytosine-5)-methyltransferase 1